MSVPGSHSNVISSASSHGAVARQAVDEALRAAASTGTTACRRRSRRSSSGRPAIAGVVGVQLPLARQEIEILLDLARVLVGVDAEVAEVAALPAERDVQVEAERHACAGGRCQRRPRVGGDRLRRPHRERRVIRDEVAADLGLLDLEGLGQIGHYLVLRTTGGICYMLGASSRPAPLPVRGLALFRVDRHQLRVRGDVRLDDGLGPGHRVGIAVAIDVVGWDQILLARRASSRGCRKSRPRDRPARTRRSRCTPRDGCRASSPLRTPARPSVDGCSRPDKHPRTRCLWCRYTGR